MTATELLRVNHYEALPGQNGAVRHVKDVPYLRLCAKGGPPIFVKNGTPYGEGGQPIETPPAWFWEEAAKCSEQARADVKLRLPSESMAVTTDLPAGQVTQSVVMSTWTCGVCSETVAMKLKGLHVARHKKRRVESAGAI